MQGNVSPNFYLNITLLKLYLKLDKQDALDIISTNVEHPKLSWESVCIVLSTALDLSKLEEGAMFGCSMFRTRKTVIEHDDGRERCVMLFFDNVLALLQSSKFAGPLAQGIVIYFQNWLGDILRMSMLSLDCVKCVWDIVKSAYK